MPRMVYSKCVNSSQPFPGKTRSNATASTYVSLHCSRIDISECDRPERCVYMRQKRVITQHLMWMAPIIRSSHVRIGLFCNLGLGAILRSSTYSGSPSCPVPSQQSSRRMEDDINPHIEFLWWILFHAVNSGHVYLFPESCV